MATVSLNYEFVSGARINSQLLYLFDDKQLFRKNKVLKDGTAAFNCRFKDCNSRLYLCTDGKCFYVNGRNEHHHECQDVDMAKLNLVNQVKQQLSLPDVVNRLQQSHIRDVCRVSIRC